MSGSCEHSAESIPASVSLPFAQHNMARRRVVISTNTDTVLGMASVDHAVSTMVLQLIASGSWDGTATIKRRLVKHPGDPSALAAVAVAYMDETTATDPLKTDALTGTSLNTIVSVRADRSEIVLTTASRSAGSLIVEYDGVDG